MTTATIKSNDLRHTINTTSKDGDSLTINIRLNDECKNGHIDFSITGDIYAKGKPRTDRNFIAGGCIHDEILSVRPDLKLFVDLHLSDAKGAPMYALENGYYHLKNTGIETAKEYLRLTDEEVDIMATASDKLQFALMLFQLNIPQRWQEEANQAIKQLEEWTGKTFVDDGVKTNLPTLTQEQETLVKERLNSGYYTPEATAQRQEDAKQTAKAKAIEKITKERDKDIKKAENAYRVKLAVLNADLSLDNFIYYSHTNEAVFNWMEYSAGISEDQFNTFLASVDFSTLPEGIKFKLGK